MNCSCIKGEGSFNFTLEPLDCETLIYKDYSEWMEGDRYSFPETYTVQVFPPGANDPIHLDLNVGESNSITSIELFGGTTKRQIPDGVYCFTLENCQYRYIKHKAVTCSLDCALDNLIATSDNIDAVDKLEFLIRSIHIKTNLGQVKGASELYSIAKKLIDKFKCNC